MSLLKDKRGVSERAAGGFTIAALMAGGLVIVIGHFIDKETIMYIGGLWVLVSLIAFFKLMMKIKKEDPF